MLASGIIKPLHATDCVLVEVCIPALKQVFEYVSLILTLAASALFSAKCRSFFFFFRKFIGSFVFMLERYIKRPFFLKTLNFFSYMSEKIEK